MMRSPVSLARLHFTAGSNEVVYASSAELSCAREAPEDTAVPDGPYRAALRRLWAELIRRVYEVDRGWAQAEGSRILRAMMAAKGQRKPRRSTR
jgi:hypothetical protein